MIIDSLKSEHDPNLLQDVTSFLCFHQICSVYFQVCGGGPKMSLWHLRSMTTTTVFDTPNVCQKTVQFYEDTVRWIFLYTCNIQY